MTIAMIHRSACTATERPPKAADLFDQRFRLGYAPWSDARPILESFRGMPCAAEALPQRWMVAMIDEVGRFAPPAMRRRMHDRPNQAIRDWSRALLLGQTPSEGDPLRAAPPAVRRLVYAAALQTAVALTARRLPQPDGAAFVGYAWWITLTLTGMARVQLVAGTWTLQHRRDLAASLIGTWRFVHADLRRTPTPDARSRAASADESVPAKAESA